ncbi:MAG TPA: hypothetical protein VMR17_18555 [Xanthobacteraceae bacterium]|nr:hypothetical protein [Xanthobacteraceae bacterium]
MTLLVAGAVAVGCVAYLLWPTWPSTPIPLDAPAIPVTVSGVLFELPPAAIRAPVQRHTGPADRVDLAFLWPSLTPPQPDAKGEDRPLSGSETDASTTGDGSERLFVTIAALGAVLPPAERLRTIYPRYVEAEADAGPDGLAILPFRAGTPYEGEDLVYLADSPEKFFARCTRQVRALRGSCLQERLIDTAEITLRFPRGWLDDWRNVAAGFDRLVTQLHPKAN